MRSLISRLKLNKRPAIIRSAIYALIWIICCLMLSWYPGTAFALAFLGAGCFDIKIEKKRCQNLFIRATRMVMMVMVRMMFIAHQYALPPFQ